MKRLPRVLLALPLALGLALALFGVWQAQQSPVVARYTVPIIGLGAPLRIVQLSDSHAGFDMPAARLRRVVAQINARRPDIVVLTGDYISGYGWTDAETRGALAPFAGLRARFGAFAILGNHDGVEQTRRGFAGTGITFLRDAGVDAGPIHLIGSDDISGPLNPVEKTRRLIRAAPGDRPVVVLAHESDFFQWLVPPAQLLIAGHSHGGQILLPFLPQPGSETYQGRHLRGLYREPGQSMIVSSGLGTSILPMRIGVPPEIVEIMLVPAYSAGRNSGTDR
ncbi:metallophosphoesterase [Sandarakinorhabdus sp. DWP1-3-1]|uniref:metallophosphoesterase n=1 Tax=Sandarakinorhabdus sp. DWP1-3-1 TaxID=2804627 RepID=UPI003CFB44F3